MLLHKISRIPRSIKRDGFIYTLKRSLAWIISHSPLAYRLSFPYYKNIRLLFTPSMLTYRVFAERQTRLGDVQTLEEHIEPGATVIDIGANAGTLTLVAAALTGNTGKVLAFEPSPKFANIIQKNIVLNHLESIVTVHQVALGASEGQVYLNENVTDDTTNYVSNSGTAVPLNTLDSFTENLNQIDFLKMDAEGSEYDILIGAPETLKKTKVLLFEICNKTLARKNIDMQALYDLLNASFDLYHKNSKEPFVFDPSINYNTDLLGYHK